MSDEEIKVVVDYTDLKMLNEYLNQTDDKVKLVQKTMSQQKKFDAYQQQAKDLENLKRSLDPVYNATVGYNQKLDLLNKTLRDKAPEEYRKQLALLQKQATRAGLQLDNFGKVVGLNSKSARQNELAFQQAGYQVQDFIIQVQGGTNPLIAFSQQASQLAGFFAGPWGAMIGLGIAAVSSLAMAFIASKQDAERFKKAMAAVGDSVSTLETVLDRAGDTIGNFGYVLSQINTREFERAMKELGENSGSAFDAGFMSTFGRFLVANTWTGFRTWGEAQGELTAEAFAEAFGTNVNVLDGVLGQIDAAISSGDGDALGDIIKGLSAFGNATEQGDEFLRQLTEIYNKFIDTETVIKREIALNEELIKLEGIRGQYGEESLKYRQAKLAVDQQIWEAEKEAYILEQARKGVSEEVAAKAWETENALERSTEQADQLRDALERAANAMSDLSGFGASVDKALVVATAKVEALKAGTDEAIAGQIAGLREDRDSKLEAAIAAGADATLALADAAITTATITALEQKLLEGKELRDANKKSKSGGGSEKDPYLVTLEREIALKESLIGKSDEERRAIEIRYELLKRGEPIENARIESLVKEQLALETVIAAEEKRLDAIKNIENNFASALNSVVDGSASIRDAFNNLMQQIVMDLYDKYVTQPISSSIGNFLSGLFMADGGAFQSGVQMYAKGDVFNSPTMFQHQGGLGVMGEAGPEAIMPLKRGRDGKLGVASSGSSSQVININQTFAFSANGDESVRKIIKQQIPVITEVTKAAVLDTKRRGGSYGKSF